MSRTTLYVVRENGDIESHQDFSNAHRGAMLVWIKLGEKYGIPDPMMLLLNEEKSKQVWGLAKRSDVSEADQITMKTTFDRVLVASEDFPKLVSAMRESAKTLPDHCSISEQADAIEKLIGDTTVVAVGWNQTSVTQAWEDYYDDAAENYNLTRANKHWYMFRDEVARTD
jgi:hypothetical protein